MTAPLTDTDVAALFASRDDSVDKRGDGAFTERVLAQLPARRRRLNKRDITLGAFAALAAGVGSLAAVHSSQLSSGMPVLAVLAVVVLGLWGALASAEA